MNCKGEQKTAYVDSLEKVAKPHKRSSILALLASIFTLANLQNLAKGFLVDNSWIPFLYFCTFPTNFNKHIYKSPSQ